MCTALHDDNGFLSFSDTSSREHCVKNEHKRISDLIGYKPQVSIAVSSVDCRFYADSKDIILICSTFYVLL